MSSDAVRTADREVRIEKRVGVASSLRSQGDVQGEAGEGVEAGRVKKENGTKGVDAESARMPCW
jgi:hypothetical protein